jgi:hypothetical protein
MKKTELFESILNEGSHKPNRITKAIPEGDFPVKELTGEWNKGGEKKMPEQQAFKKEFQTYDGDNPPRCAREYDTYTARYAKTGSLTESRKPCKPRLRESEQALNPLIVRAFSGEFSDD